MLMWIVASAFAADLWLDIEVDDDDAKVMVHMPANDLPSSKRDATIDVNGTKVDLRAEAELLTKKGSGEKRFKLDGDEGQHLVLRMVDAPTNAAPVTTFVLSIRGPMGIGMDLNVPFDGDLGKLNDKMGGNVDIDGVDMTLTEAHLAQLKAAGPVDLIRVTGAAGEGLTISTK